MKYDRDFLEINLHNILMGFSPFVVDGVLYYAKHFTPQDFFEANANNFLLRQDLKNQNVASEYEILKKHEQVEVWDKNKDMDILSLESQIQRKKEILPKLALPSQVKQIEGDIKNLLNQLEKKKDEKGSLTVNSLEHRLLNEKRDFLAYLCIYESLEKRKWDNYVGFLDLDNEIFFNFVNTFFQTIGEIKTPLLRAIARDTEARYRLKVCSAKTQEKYSNSMIELKQWCDFYQSIYDLEDRPTEKIISDDDKLDGWITSRRAKRDLDKSVNNDSTFVGVMNATKEDMEVLGGTDRETALKMVKEGRNGV